MKIDRRSFLSFVIGGAAGTALSPLPYKLTDDLSIWSQNWPWTPVPPDGEVSYVDSTCTLCPGGCGISVRKVDQRAVKVEGMKGHPINDGGLCLLGLSGLQLLYGPTRVRQPLQRMGRRGEGRWRAISWPEAISQVVAKMRELRSADNPHTVGCILESDRGTVPLLFDRFLTAYGSPNLIRTPSYQDSYELTLHVMHGVQAMAGFDLENATFVFSFGSGLIDGWGSPVRMFRAHAAWRQNNAKVIQVEPRLSNTAAKADHWIAIRPGTEAALALGMAHVIVKESLYRKEFVENNATGFSGWTDGKGQSHMGFKELVLAEYGPDKVAQITGVGADAIESLAREFARAERPLALCGRGRGMTPGSTGEFMAVHALNALVGNINRPGGIWALPEPDYVGWAELEMDDVASRGIQRGSIDGSGNSRYLFARSLLNRLPEILNAGKEYGLQMLMVHGANPCYTLPDSKTVNAAFGKIPFVVSFSSYMDETAKNSDLILPNHTYLERYEDVPAPAGLSKPFIGFTRPVVPPQFNTRHTGDVVIQLAKTMGGHIGRALPWGSYEECLKDTLKDKWRALTEEGFWHQPDFRPPAGAKAFETASQKFEFFATAIHAETKKDLDALPHYRPVEPEGDKSAYPLVLIPCDSMRLAAGFIGTPPFMIKTVEDTVLKGEQVLVEVNPETAKRLGLAEGKTAVLATPKGQITVKVHLFDGIMPDVVAMPRGLGHSAYDKYLAKKGANFNEVVGPVADPISGLDTAWGIRARLQRA
ncbi:MAG: menaquinone reductase molybdopterin-binding-like subunit QrcB [Thermodesulfobacteriota bacterium]